MEGELATFLSVWGTVIASLYYCHLAGKLLPAGNLRCLLLLPVVFLFLLLPLPLSSVHFCGFTAFFISWLANFKLLLYAYDRGPLSPQPPLPFRSFLAIACFPIKPQPAHSATASLPAKNGFLKWVQKLVSFAIVIHLYNYADWFHHYFVMLLRSLHVYLVLDMVLGTVATMAKILVGMELEPQFKSPLLATSLQDFWGRRWNIMVSSVFRPAVYHPVVNASIPFVGRRWASIPGVLATFTVSAIMHELVYFYLCRVWPTWEISWFFIIHGVCEAMEIAVKKVVGGRVKVHPVVSVPITVVFVLATAFWLFFRQLIRCDVPVKAMKEMTAVGGFFRRAAGQALLQRAIGNSTAGFWW